MYYFIFLNILSRLVGEDTSMDGLNQLLHAAPTPNTPLSGGRLHSSTSPHLALTVALYAHQRLNPRLSYLALRTLTRFAQVRWLRSVTKLLLWNCVVLSN